LKEKEAAEDALKEAMGPFIQSMFARFHMKRRVWEQLIECVAELDCLMAFATFAANVRDE